MTGSSAADVSDAKHLRAAALCLLEDAAITERSFRVRAPSHPAYGTFANDREGRQARRDYEKRVHLATVLRRMARKPRK